MLWAGYFVVAYGVGFGLESVDVGTSLLFVTLLAYLAYGLVLGGVYDHLVEHRTFLSEASPEMVRDRGL